MLTMMTPLDVLTDLVEEVRSASRSPQSFLEALKEFDRHLEGHARPLDDTAVPSDYPEGQELLLTARDGYELFGQALELLRSYAGTLESQLAEQGLELAAEAQALLQEAQGQTAANLDRWEDEL